MTIFECLQCSLQLMLFVSGLVLLSRFLGKKSHCRAHVSDRGQEAEELSIDRGQRNHGDLDLGSYWGGAG